MPNPFHSANWVALHRRTLFLSSLDRSGVRIPQAQAIPPITQAQNDFSVLSKSRK